MGQSGPKRRLRWRIWAERRDASAGQHGGAWMRDSLAQSDQRGSQSGEGAGAAVGGSTGRPRCARIFSITAWSSIVATKRKRPPPSGQAKMSISKVRRRSPAHGKCPACSERGVDGGHRPILREPAVEARLNEILADVRRWREGQGSSRARASIDARCPHGSPGGSPSLARFVVAYSDRMYAMSALRSLGERLSAVP